MKRLFVLAVLTASPAWAADVALILNDEEQKALRQVLDAATRDRGLEMAGITVYFANKLRAAGTVTERKDEPADKKEPQQ